MQDGQIIFKKFYLEGGVNNVQLSSSKEVPCVLFSARYVAASWWSSPVVGLLIGFSSTILKQLSPAFKI